MDQDTSGVTSEQEVPEKELKEIIANLYLSNEQLRKRAAKTDEVEDLLKKAYARIQKLEDALRILGSSEVSTVGDVRKIVVSYLRTPPVPEEGVIEISSDKAGTEEGGGV